VRDYFKEHEPKGEIVIILAGKPNDKNTNVEEYLFLL
jgi:16S rRNA C1402 (ribose-2'-O) methylase RsmI